MNENAFFFVTLISISTIYVENNKLQGAHIITYLHVRTTVDILNFFYLICEIRDMTEYISFMKSEKKNKNVN